MKLPSDNQETGLIPIEEDVPKEDVPKEDVPKEYFPMDNRNSTEQNKVSKDVFNTIKGHFLLGCCVFILVVIYGIESIFHKGSTTDIAERVIEIIKLLIFSLTGYLFGTNGTKGD
ncbi:Uncharacterised protein [Streptococcus salivarius]|nr:Uncharacterised protein [Streptococcus salivarius]VUW82198.1 Uncharacterised protein [Streptococcus thermophilus]